MSGILSGQQLILKKISVKELSSSADIFGMSSEQNAPGRSNFAASLPRPLSFRVSMVPFSFAFSIIFLIEFLLVASAISWGWLSMRENMAGLENSFYLHGRQLASGLSASAAVAEKHKDYAPLNAAFARVVRDYRNQAETAAVSEVFYLAADGRVLAHSDPTFLTADIIKSKKKKKKRKQKKDPTLSKLSETELKYNNEFFHAALLTEEDEVLARNYPYPSYDLRENSYFFLKDLLPDNLDYSMDFSAVVYAGTRKTGTVHVVMNRVFLYDTANRLVEKFWLLLGIIASAGFLISFLIIAAFVLRGKFLQKLWLKLLSDIDAQRSMEHKIKNIETKVDELEERKSIGVPASSTEEEVVEAIFVEE